MSYKFDTKALNKLEEEMWKERHNPRALSALEDQRDALWATYHNHPKVAIGDALIIDDPAILAKYKRKKPYMPRYRKRPAATRPTGKRVVGFEGGYSIPYIPRKVACLPETTLDVEYAGWYVDGFWSNGAYVVKVPCPKTKRPLNPDTDRMETLLSAYSEPMTLPPAVIGKETYDSEGFGKPIVTVYGETVVLDIQAEYLDIIYRYHPGFKAHIKDNMAIFTIDGNMVGIIMAVK